MTDFDGDGLTYSWQTGPTVLASGVVLTTGGGGAVSLPPVTVATGPNGRLDLGSHTVSLTVMDGFNDPVTCDVIAQVVDTEAPTLAPTSDCSILWPPNHQMVPVTIQANAADSSGGPVLLSAQVTSNENPEKNGAGNTVPDWTTPVIDQVTGVITLSLRAERSGRGTGRTYTITITATDSVGNTSTAAVTCIAPHDRGQ